MAARKHSRSVFIILVLTGVGAIMAYAFWPRPMLVDIAVVRQEPMRVTINEEGRTQVHNPYVVSTPVAGRLLRAEVEVGDRVTKQKTVVARMLPTIPSALDVRTREQATANVTAAEASLRVAEADLNKALADRDLAKANLDRTLKLNKSGIISDAALERDERTARAAEAALDTARAAISMRVAQLNNARAQLISFDGQNSANTGAEKDAAPILAPADGIILRVYQQSEITLPAGAPIMEIGDVDRDLEIVAELLSTDAVAVRVGAPVIVDNWGGAKPLAGVITKIEPRGFTKVSALGVEEQRVRIFVDFKGDSAHRTGLGHGFRVEVRIVIWAAENALTIPSSGLFRNAGEWSVFAIDVDNRARVRRVQVAANNGLRAAISVGLKQGGRIVAYPSASLTDGAWVAPRTND